MFDPFTANNSHFSKPAVRPPLSRVRGASTLTVNRCCQVASFAHETGAAVALIVSNTDPPRRQHDFPPDHFYFSPASRAVTEPSTQSAAEATREAWLKLVVPVRLVQTHSEEELREMVQQAEKGLQQTKKERQELEERLSELEREAKRLRDLGLLPEEGVLAPPS